MKTGISAVAERRAPIVRSVDDGASTADPDQPVEQARSFAAPLLSGERLDSSEDTLAHADAMVEILRGIGAAPQLCAATYLVYAAGHLGKPDEAIAKAFGPSQAGLVSHTRKLMRLQRAALGAQVGEAERLRQTERVRKMLLAFSSDLRVVLLRLASRLHSMRFHAASKTSCPAAFAQESLQVFAPLANRLGIWQIKWELEDLSFRFLEPVTYRRVAALLDERRAEREQHVEALRRSLERDLAHRGQRAEVQGRPKHIYSIWKKMQAKELAFGALHDVRALRVIVADVAACYAVLGRVHELYRAVPGQLDDYIASPKPNGYRSLHTVVVDTDGRHVEIQIRTREMHEHAEYGVSAHWAYKEAAGRGRTGAASAGEFASRVAAARIVVLRQLLAWERDLAQPERSSRDPASSAEATAVFDDRIYVFTPQAAVLELTAGATPVDFAYAVHTELGHRCRGAKVDGVMVSLDTPLQNGQTVEVSVAKSGGPSLDWLNPELGFLRSQRSRTKVRAWFNAQARSATVARGREAVEKLLQRESKTALNHLELAGRLGFRSADALFEVVGKDELSLRSIEALLRPTPGPRSPDDGVELRRSRAEQPTRDGGVLVVGVGSLLTALARCCRPMPPDAIGGYVTRGKGVAVHRVGCSDFRQLRSRSPERVIAVAWADSSAAQTTFYPVDIGVESTDRQGLLRDVAEVLAKQNINVVAVKTRAAHQSGSATAFMTLTVEVADGSRLLAALAQLGRIDGVSAARRQ